MDKYSILRDLIQFNTVFDAQNKSIMEYCDAYLTKLGFRTNYVWLLVPVKMPNLDLCATLILFHLEIVGKTMMQWICQLTATNYLVLVLAI